MNLVGKPNYPEDEPAIGDTTYPHFATPAGAGLFLKGLDVQDAIMLCPLEAQIEDACCVELRERRGDS